MVVSMIQLILEIPGNASLKDKRRVIHSLREKLIHKFKVTAAEVDLQDSLQFSQIGAAYVSNSRDLGVTIMNKALIFVEKNLPGRIIDSQIHTEFF
jgi:uncharacterized protein YlxP (DUF503 family)